MLTILSSTMLLPSVSDPLSYIESKTLKRLITNPTAEFKHMYSELGRVDSSEELLDRLCGDSNVTIDDAHLIWVGCMIPNVWIRSSDLSVSSYISVIEIGSEYNLFIYDDCNMIGFDIFRDELSLAKEYLTNTIMHLGEMLDYDLKMQYLGCSL